MGKLSSTPLYQQFSKSFIGLFVIVTVILTLASTLYLYNNAQLQQLVSTRLPALERQDKINHLNHQINTTIDSLLSAETAIDIEQKHQILTQTLVELNNEPSLRSTALIRLLSELEKTAEPITRFTRNSSRNIQLQQSSVIQVQLISDQLNQIIQTKEQAQASLYQQIIQDTVNDKVTASRARAHAKVMQEVNLLRQMQSLLKLVLIDLQQLDVQLPLNLFDLMADRIERFFLVFNNAKAFDIQSNADFVSQVKALNGLFNDEQRMIAKWRGHLRLTESYLQAMADVKQRLPEILRPKTSTLRANSGINFHIEKLFSQIGVKEKKDIPIVIMAIMGLFILSLLVLALKMLGRLKRFFNESEALSKQWHSDSESVAEITSAEAALFQTLLDNLQKPKYGEADVKRLQTHNLHQLTTLLKQCQIAYWQVSPSEHLVQDQYLTSLLDSNNELKAKSWRHWFGKEASLKIIKALRAAKANGEVQNVQVNTVLDKAVLINIDYQDAWFGTTCDYQVVDALNKVIDKLHTESLESEQEHIRRQISNNDQLFRQLIRTLIQSQLRYSDESATNNSLYRQITNIYDWCQQGKMATQMHSAAKSLQLSDIHLIDEINAIALNAQTQANIQRNQISVSIDDMVSANVQVDETVLQLCLKSIFKLLLSEQFNAELAFHLQLKDKNKGQQILALNFSVNSAKKTDALPNQLAQLVDDEYIPSSSYSLVQCLRDIFTSLHADNIDAQYSEQGYQFSFDLPLTLSEVTTKKHEPLDLKQLNILLLSEDKNYRTLIKSNVKQANGVIEALASKEAVVKQLSVKHLNRKKVDILAIADDSLLSSHDFLIKHINTLPHQLQPKILATQPISNAKIARQGLYSLASSPFGVKMLLAEMLKLHQSDKESNQVIAAEEFSKFKFDSTQVEILLACTEPDNKQPLVRLLAWLGLQVTVVTHEVALKKHWQSGRYLLLLSEFDTNPFVKFLVGNSVKRGCFTFSSEQLTAFEQAENTIGENWYKAVFPPVEQLENIVELLSPWLKKAETLNVTNVAKTVQVKKERKAIEQDSELALAHGSTALEPNEAAFNLQRFANNQGSPELAALMLEEYIVSNQQHFEQLKTSCFEHDVDGASEALKQLTINARIMAADNLLACCHAIESVIQQDIQALSGQLNTLELELGLVADFAEAI